MPTVQEIKIAGTAVREAVPLLESLRLSVLRSEWLAQELRERNHAVLTLPDSEMVNALKSDETLLALLYETATNTLPDQINSLTAAVNKLKDFALVLRPLIEGYEPPSPPSPPDAGAPE